MSDIISPCIEFGKSAARIAFDYTNYRGEKARRCAECPRVYWGATVHHPEPQWLAAMFDLDRREWRTFAMKDMSNIQSAEP